MVSPPTRTSSPSVARCKASSFLVCPPSYSYLTRPVPFLPFADSWNLSPDYIPRFREGEEALSKWIAEGKLKSPTYVHNGGKGGIEGAPGGIVGLFDGKNTGKVCPFKLLTSLSRRPRADWVSVVFAGEQMVVQFWDASKEEPTAKSKL